MSLLYRFNSLGNSLTTNVGNLGKLVGAGKLAQSAVGVLSLQGEEGNSTVGYRGVSSNKMKVKVKRRRGTKKTKVATVSAVRRMISGVQEKKQFPYVASTTYTTANASLVHSTNMTAKILQGTTDGTRVGDVIELGALHYNIKMVCDATASYYTLRMIVGWSGEEYNPTGFTTGGLGTTEIFVNSGTDASTMVINTKAFTPLVDFIVDINSNVSAVNDGKTLRGTVPLNQKFEYQKAGDTYGKKKNLYVVFIPSYGGIAPATNLMVNVQQFVITFKDS